MHLPRWGYPFTQPSRYKCAYGGRGSSKDLHVETPIRTPQGWTTIGALRPGNQLYDERGQTCHVTGVFPQGNRELWEVCLDDAKPIYAGAGHLWVTAPASKFAPSDWATGRTQETRDVVPLRDGIPYAESRLMRRVHSVRATGEYAPTVCIEVDSPNRLFLCGLSDVPTHNTWTFAHILVAQALVEPLRIHCCREFTNALSVSSKLALEQVIHRMGVADKFKIQNNRIVGINGSVFEFYGIEVNRESIRGWENVDRVWIEEAQRLTPATARVLVPTIRKPGSEMWFSWNPYERTDWVWRRFIMYPRDDDVIAKVNWQSNPWFPEEANAERLADQVMDPALYAHIWEGEPNDTALERKVLPYEMLRECVQAYQQGLHKEAWGSVHVGLDVADQGTNALVCRYGPVVEHGESWQSYIIGDTARRAHSYAREHDAQILVYDAGGLGAGVRSYLSEMTDRAYAARPELFGGSVKGGEELYSYRLTNTDFFARRNAQMAWGLRLRAQYTKRLLEGENVPVNRCLFINPDIPHLDEFMAQLAQPTWKENVAGRIEINKVPDNEASPDLFDATCLAFARDSEYGLKAR